MGPVWIDVWCDRSLREPGSFGGRWLAQFFVAELVQVRSDDAVQFRWHDRIGLGEHASDQAAAFAGDDRSLSSFAKQRDREERDDRAQECSFGESKQSSDLAIEFFQSHSVDHPADHSQCDPDYERRANEQDEHRQELIPWRSCMNVLAEWFAIVVRDAIADDDGSD